MALCATERSYEVKGHSMHRLLASVLVVVLGGCSKDSGSATGGGGSGGNGAAAAGGATSDASAGGSAGNAGGGGSTQGTGGTDGSVGGATSSGGAAGTGTDAGSGGGGTSGAGGTGGTIQAPGIECGAGGGSKIYCNPQAQYCCVKGSEQSCVPTGTGCAGTRVACTASVSCPSGKECCALPGESAPVGSIDCVADCGAVFGTLVCSSNGKPCAGNKSCKPLPFFGAHSGCQ